MTVMRAPKVQRRIGVALKRCGGCAPQVQPKQQRCRASLNAKEVVGGASFQPLCSATVWIRFDVKRCGNVKKKVQLTP